MRLRGRLGFGAADEAGEHVAVVQSDLLTAFPTILVVPLDVATDVNARDPTAVRVTKKEIGERVDYVALTAQVGPVAADSLSPGVVGRLAPRTLVQVDRMLKLVLDL